MRAVPHQTKTRRRGLTLIELIVVIVLVGIVSATILPRFKGSFHGALLSSTARELVASMKLAASQAATVGRTHRLLFDTNDGSYWLEVLAESEEGVRGYEKVRQGVSIAARTGLETGIIDPRITFELVPSDRDEDDETERGPRPKRRAREGAGQPAIFFRPDGTADGCRMLLRDPDGFGVELRIHGGTARVSARDLPREEPRG